MLNIQPKEEECVGMAGIIQEGKKIIQEQGDPNVKDAALIGAAQKVEHYEISAYGTLRTFARVLGHNAVAQQLQRTLREESSADEILTQVAERSINRKAA